MDKETRPRVVVLGAGFGGLRAARRLSGARADVTLVDRNNYHTFLPLLYQVGAAEVEPEQIAYPVRSILRHHPDVRFIRAGVRGIDLASRTLDLGDRSIPYDFLVIAVGSVTGYFGIPGAREYTFPLKTLDEGVVLRNHILTCFERAVHEPDEARREATLTFTIVGGGPTGVEFAGALRELVTGPLKKDYPFLDLSQVRVILLDYGDRLLAHLPSSLSAYTLKRLEKMGVEVMLRRRVVRVTPDMVELEGGESIPTGTVVWSGGVSGDGLLRQAGLPITPAGRIKVLTDLQVPGYDNVFVIGDIAHLEEGGRPLPMIAPVAIQQGRAAAENIRLRLSGKETRPFRYSDRGSMVTIGRNAAVAQVARMTFRGFLAWVIWLSIHLMNLIGFRNRLLVLINWAWDYLFFERAVRLILPACCDNPLGKSCRACADGGKDGTCA